MCSESATEHQIIEPTCKSSSESQFIAQSSLTELKKRTGSPQERKCEREGESLGISDESAKLVLSLSLSISLIRRCYLSFWHGLYSFELLAFHV